MISIKNLSFTYRGFKNPTLKNINMTIADGEKVLILGASGCGKTTLSRVLNGLIPATYHGTLTGSVEIDGEDILEKSIAELSLRIGTVLQDPEGQFVGLTVAEDVAFGLENLGLSREEMNARVDESLRLVGMEKFKTHAPHELSGGQKQKVAIAGVLAMGPDILLFDEPLANLDPASAASVVALMDNLNRQGKTIIVIEHRFEEVLEGGVDKVALMKDGELIAFAPPREIINSGLLAEAGIRLPLFCEVVARINRRQDLPVTLTEAVSILRNEKIHGPVEPSGVGEAKGDTPLLSLENVSFCYNERTPVLKDISLSVYPGERVALLGHNGAGKTTLSLLLLGLLKPTAGNIYVNGQNITGLPVSRIARSIGLVMQNPNHMLSLPKVEDEVAFGPVNLKFSPPEIAEGVETSLKTCDLWPYRKWPTFALSYGQKKRLTVAAILAMHSKLLLLDEPTVGQDYRHYREFMDFMARLCDAGYTMIVITHDLNLAQEYTERTLVLVDGRLIGDGPTRRILAEEKLLEQAALRPTSLTRLARELGLGNVALSSAEMAYMLIGEAAS